MILLQYIYYIRRQQNGNEAQPLLPQHHNQPKQQQQGGVVNYALAVPLSVAGLMMYAALSTTTSSPSSMTSYGYPCSCFLDLTSVHIPGFAVGAPDLVLLALSRSFFSRCLRLASSFLIPLATNEQSGSDGGLAARGARADGARLLSCR